MKKSFKILVTLISLVSITACSNTPPEKKKDRGRPPRAEKISEEEFYAGLSLDSATKAQLNVILDDFKDTLDSTMKDSNPPKREEMDKLIAERDAKVKPLLNEDQYSTYKNTVEGLFVPEHGGKPRM